MTATKARCINLAAAAEETGLTCRILGVSDGKMWLLISASNESKRRHVDVEYAINEMLAAFECDDLLINGGCYFNVISG